MMLKNNVFKNLELYLYTVGKAYYMVYKWYWYIRQKGIGDSLIDEINTLLHLQECGQAVDAPVEKCVITINNEENDYEKS